MGSKVAAVGVALFLLGSFPLLAQVLGNEVGAVPAGPSFPVATSNAQVAGGAPDVATDGTDFIVVTANTGTSELGTDVYATRVTAAGVVLDTTPIQLVNNPNGISDPSVVFDGTDYVVVWIGAAPSTSPGYGEVYAARVSPDGTVLDTTPVDITGGAEAKFRPIGVDFDSTDQNFLVAWRDQNDDIEAARFSTALVDLDAASGFMVAAGSTNLGRFYPWVAFGGGEYLIVWHQGYGGSGGGGCTQAIGCVGALAIAGARVTPAGQVLDPGGFAISSDPNDLQDFAAAAFDGSNFLVTWHNWANSDVYNNGSGSAARVTPGGVVLDQPAIAINSKQLWESRAPPVFDGTNYFVAWHVDQFEKFRLADVFGTRISTAGQLLDEKPSPVATGFDQQWAPSVGYAGGTILAVWNENNETAVYGQILQESTNAGAARASVNPSPNSSNWIVSGTPVDMSLQAVFGYDNSHVYSSGEASGPPFLEFDGSSWSSIASPGRDHLYGIWGATPSSLWATGWCTEFLQFNPSTNSFSDLGCTTGAAAWLSVWGSNPGNVFAVGSNYGVSTPYPLYGYYNGQNWTSPEGIGISLDLAGIWGTDADNVYAVGEQGTILHWDGNTWTPVSGVPTIERLNGVWTDSAADTFAVGDFGTILHYDGTGWTAQASGVTDDLTSVWGFNGSDVYAVGSNGRILYFDGTSWTAEASPTTENLTAVTGAGNSVWAVGDVGAILQLVTTGNPTPEIASISPDSAPPTQDVAIQVNGENFVSGSAVRWNESDVPTVFVSSTELTATIPQGDFASAFPATPPYPNGWGEITVSSPAPQGGISSGLVLAIEATAGATLSVPSLTFSPQAVGTTSAAQPVTLSNSGNITLNISSISPSANFTETDNCGGSVGPNGSCTLSISFAPTALGPLTGTVSISDNAAGSPQTISVSGTGALAATVTVEPGASSIATTQALTVGVTVSGGTGNPTPTGSVTLSSGKYLSVGPYTQTFQTADLYINQGYATDGTNNYIFFDSAPGSGEITEYNSTWSTVLNSNPDTLTGISGVDHEGDGAYYNGNLYLSLQAYGGCIANQASYLAIFSATATGLPLVTSANITAYDTGGALGSGVAVVPSQNALYLVDYCDGSKMWVFNLTTLAFEETIPLAYTIDYLQGISYNAATNSFFVTADVLYPGTNLPTGGGGTIFQVSLDGTTVTPVYQTSAQGELEGLDYTTSTLRYVAGGMVIYLSPSTQLTATLGSGAATIAIPGATLAAGSYTFTAGYTPDADSSSTYAAATGTAASAVTVTAVAPTVTVAPGASSITTGQALSVTVTVSDGAGNPIPTGSVTLGSGKYTSAAATLSGGAATINIPAGSLAAGSYLFTAGYTPDTNSSSIYAAATGTAASAVTVAAFAPTVTVSPGASSITTAQALSVTVTVSGGTGDPIPTGSVTLSSGKYTSAAATLNGGAATIAIPAATLAAGSYTFTAGYAPDTNSSSMYTAATGSAATTVTVTAFAPTVTVAPGASSITTVQALTVKVTVSSGSGAPTPTGTVTLSSGKYTSAATTLSSGAATINLPSGTLAAGSYAFTAGYTPDTNSSSIYATATGSAASAVTVTEAVPTVTVAPGASSVDTAQALMVKLTVSGGSGTPTPTGSVTLSSGKFTSAAATLSSGAATVNVPAGSLAVGIDTLAAAYSGDSTYSTATGTGPVTVNLPPGFTLSASPTSVSVAQGGSETSTIAVTSVGGFSSAVTLSASGLPSGVTASFAAGSAAGTQKLTFTAATSVAAHSLPLTVIITGSSGTLTAATSIALTITAQPAFTAGSGGTTSLTISPGAISAAAISVVGTYGFSGTVNLSCQVTTSMANVIDMPGCSLIPTSVTLSGTDARKSTLRVTTTGASSARNQMKRLFWPTAGGTTLALALFFAVPKRRRDWLATMGLLLLFACLGAGGCAGGGSGVGGSGGSGDSGTTPGVYTITVTGTAGSISATVVSVTLTVQ
ncbi:MAG: Ig-like domain repeat protein [Terracidiphilus sp.]